MSIKHVQFALDGVPGLNAGQRLTLVSLGEWANEDGVCWPSHDTIAKRVGVGRRQVIRIIDQLESMGVIERIERKQYSNKYRVRCDIAMSHPKPSPDVTSTTADVTSRASRCDTHATRTVIEPPIRTPNEPPERARAKRATAVPESIEVSDEQYGWAWGELGLQRSDVDRETAKLIDHFRSTGETKKDWGATWRNWMRRSLEFRRSASNGRASPVRDDVVTRNLRNLGVLDDATTNEPVFETTGVIRR